MKMNLPKNILFALALLAFSCNNSQKAEEKQDEEVIEKVEVVKDVKTVNALSAEEKAAGWELLFDGTSLNGWHTYLKENVEGWKVEDGLLITEGGNGDIVTDEDFQNFELYFEWNISEMGNSGILFNIIEDEQYAATYVTAPEYQLIDDNNYPQKLTDKQKSGANYDIHPPKVFAAKAPGEFNESKLIVNNGHVEHWLNGEKVVEYQLWSDEWKAEMMASKFAKMEGYATAKKGKIGIQDHGNLIALRNIKIRKL